MAAGGGGRMRPGGEAPCLAGNVTGMALSVLTEVGRLLEHLAATGEPAAIDLRSLPLTDADRQQLEEWLGRGTVHVELDLVGPSEIWETAYPGAWWIRHRGADDRVSSEEIAICTVPDILPSPAEDIEAAARLLRQDLERRLSGGKHSETTPEASHV